MYNTSIFFILKNFPSRVRLVSTNEIDFILGGIRYE